MTKHSSSFYVAVSAAIVWGWIVAVLAWLLLQAFGMGLHQGGAALTKSLPLLFFFFCLPVLAFAFALLGAIRMSKGDMRDRPAAIALLVIGVPWALMQTFAFVLGL